jgi:hypothetical protein
MAVQVVYVPSLHDDKVEFSGPQFRSRAGNLTGDLDVCLRENVPALSPLPLAELESIGRNWNRRHDFDDLRLDLPGEIQMSFTIDPAVTDAGEQKRGT